MRGRPWETPAARSDVGRAAESVLGDHRRCRLLSGPARGTGRDLRADRRRAQQPVRALLLPHKPAMGRPLANHRGPRIRRGGLPDPNATRVLRGFTRVKVAAWRSGGCRWITTTSVGYSMRSATSLRSTAPTRSRYGRIAMLPRYCALCRSRCNKCKLAGSCFHCQALAPVSLRNSPRSSRPATAPSIGRCCKARPASYSRSSRSPE